MINAVRGNLAGAGAPPPTDVGGPPMPGGGGGAAPPIDMSGIAESLKKLPPDQQGDQLAGLAKTLKSYGAMQQNFASSPLAQRMFQEHQQQTMQQAAVAQAQAVQNSRQDMATRILSSQGLL
jgi:hypothetical protein